MTTTTLPRVLATLRNNLPILCVLGALVLGSTPSARAQLTFTIDVFTTHTLTLTLNPGSLTTEAPSILDLDEVLCLVDYTALNTRWMTAEASTTTLAGTGQIGSTILDYASAYDNSVNGDRLIFFYVGDLAPGATLAAPYQVSFTGTNAFDPDRVTTFALYWGLEMNTAVLQTIGAATAGSTSSAVPEPATYATILGVGALGVMLVRRRMR